MGFDYTFNPELTVPIYRQLVDKISSAIRKGELENGKKLPTVSELSEELGVARGTVKRIYDELERTGLIEKVQGRGTFVSFLCDGTLSRKERAMSAIDSLLDGLEALGFSAAEINIFLNLKMRQRAEQTANVQMALLECNPEVLSSISEQLRAINQLELYSYLLDSVKQYPYKIGDGVDLIVTTDTHAQEVESLIPVNKRVVRVALRLTPDCLSQIVKLRSGQDVGILCYSPRFGHLIKNTCDVYTDGVCISAPLSFSDESFEEYIGGKNVLLVPEFYEKYCSEKESELLKAFKGQLIVCSYELDEGSFIYLREKTKRILESKSI